MTSSASRLIPPGRGYYSLDMLLAQDYAGENLSLDYHQPPKHPFDNFIPVNN